MRVCEIGKSACNYMPTFHPKPQISGMEQQGEIGNGLDLESGWHGFPITAHLTNKEPLDRFLRGRPVWELLRQENA
jgi:hypothetical protein